MKRFVDNFVYPLAAGLTLYLLTGLGSTSTTGRWGAWFKRIPWPAWILITAFFLVWLVIVFIRSRLRRLRSHAATVIVSSPMNETEALGEIRYKGVLWRVNVPKPLFRSLTHFKPPSPDEIVVSGSAICPKCKTVLEEKPMLLGSYKWSCVLCGFSIKNRESSYSESERAQRIAQSLYESVLESLGRDVSKDSSAGDSVLQIYSEKLKTFSNMMPKLAGQTLHEAGRRIREAGLVFGTVTKKPIPRVDAGIVVHQSIPSGTEVSKGTRVDLVVAIPERE